jgi:hypothetical protein
MGDAAVDRMHDGLPAIVSECLSAVAKMRAEPVHWLIAMLFTPYRQSTTIGRFTLHYTQYFKVAQVKKKNCKVMIDGIEGGAEVQQHKRRHLASIDDTHKVSVE